MLRRTPSGEGGARAESSALALFLVGAVSMYFGAAAAVEAFDEVDPVAVAWLRVVTAAVVLGAVSGRRRGRWTAAEVRSAAAFGVATAAMNTFFYLAIDRLPLGTAVAVEFTGPVAVAAATSRSRRSVGALVLAAAGVVLVSGARAEGSATGLVFALAAATCWAGYIVLGARVSRLERGAQGVALALAFGSLALAPLGLPRSGPAFDSAGVLLACAAAGVLSSAVPYGIDQIVLRRVSAGAFALLQALLPVTAAVVGRVVLGQTLRPAELAGIALVVAAVGLRRPGREEPAPA